MTVRESSITRSILERLKKAGILAWKNHGNPMTRGGVPDIQAVHRGVTYYLEVKRPGEVPTPLQAAFHRKLEAAGAPVFVVHSADEALECIFQARRDRPYPMNP